MPTNIPHGADANRAIRNISKIILINGQRGFGTIHLAEWFDGQIEQLNIENQQWKRYGRRRV
ncbi:17133_t:CDS:2, partial [Dentiscutata erythropus]